MQSAQIAPHKKWFNFCALGVLSHCLSIDSVFLFNSELNITMFAKFSYDLIIGIFLDSQILPCENLLASPSSPRELDAERLLVERGRRRAPPPTAAAAAHRQ